MPTIIAPAVVLAVSLALTGGFSHAGESPDPQFRPALGPYVQFDSPTSATICWQTKQPSSTICEYGLGGGSFRRVQCNPATTRHRVTLKGLKHQAEYEYRIVVERDGSEVKSATHTLENRLNYSLPPISNDATVGEPAAVEFSARRAQEILEDTEINKGYCLVYGVENGALALELARRSELIVVCVDDDAQRVASVRRSLQQVNAYGPRITVRHVASLVRLPMSRWFANLVVAERTVSMGDLKEVIGEIHRVLRPGGVVSLGWAIDASSPSPEPSMLETFGEIFADVEIEATPGLLSAKLVRGPLDGVGHWSHQYGSPDNSTYAGESLGGVTSTDRLQVQWIGRPGADFGIDRNPRMPAPLSVNGRLFHQGMNRIIALDAYNGGVLWQLEIPDLRRVNIPRDASNWCADEQRLFVAVGDRCWVLGAGDGNLVQAYELPGPWDEGEHEWGYVARSGGTMYGTAVKRGSSHTEFWGHDAWYDKASGSAKVCSDGLFAFDVETGVNAWSYAGGVILNTTITIGGDWLYLIESRNPSVLRLDTGRINIEQLWQDQYLVALDKNSGKKLWEQGLETVEGTMVFFLSHSDETLVLMASTSGKYHLYALDAATGQRTWRAEHPWTRTNHSGHMQHPAIVGGVIYLEPLGYDLRSGEVVTRQVGRHEGCATYVATDNALIYRGESRRVAMWGRDSEVVTSWFNLRPSCWLSTIPAGGMVLSPESGGGCSCGNWLETSLGFAPRPPVGEPDQ